MSWAKFDDQYPDHPKIVAVGPLGMALHTAATCYCARYLTDGFVPAAMIPRLVSLDGIFIISNAVSNGVSHAVTHKEITDELTSAGLLEIVEGGYMVHDYLKYNPPAEQVKAERAKNAERQADWKAKHPKKPVSNGVSNGTIIPPRTRPPSPEELKKGEPEDDQPDPFFTKLMQCVKVPVNNATEVSELNDLSNSYPAIFWDVMAWIGTTNPNSITKVIRMAGTALPNWSTRPKGKPAYGKPSPEQQLAESQKWLASLGA